MTATKFKPNSDTIDGRKMPRKARNAPPAYPHASFTHGTFHASKAEDEQRLEHLIDALPAHSPIPS